MKNIWLDIQWWWKTSRDPALLGLLGAIVLFIVGFIVIGKMLT